MNSTNLVEPKRHGTQNFPVAYYLVDPMHPEYIGSAHWHKEYEISWIHSGHLETSIDGQDVESNPGDLLFVPSGSLHVNRPDNCTYDCMAFNFDILLNQFDGVSKHLAPIISRTKEVLYNISSVKFGLDNTMHKIRRAMVERPAAYELQVVSALLELFQKLYQNDLIHPTDLRSVKENMALNRLKQVLDYIDENMSSKITLSDMADMAGLSSKYFCQYFNNVMKTTPVHYINSRRIASAQLLLSKPNASVTDVAYSVGFTDVGYFIKLFKRFTGSTPKAYAKALSISSD